ncbi:MAG TPA: hypothetical protein VEO01_29050 [Pseudonocardiaceae bacterium]|nr:hypothetical protein [Pseudonocardiaceae bacterium]
MLANPDARAWLDQLAQIGTPAPVLCEVVTTHHCARMTTPHPPLGDAVSPA